jgi:transmembrane 9 superfamily protein 2/4
MTLLLSLLLAWVAIVQGSYYLPGVHPNYYQQGEAITLKANKVISTKSPLQFEYYDLPFCKKGRTRSKADNLGERLSGDTVTNSPYEVRILSSTLFIIYLD